MMYGRIEALEANLEAAKRDYLTRWGWQQTCNTPGAYWLWRRDFRQEDQARRRSWRRRKPGPLGKPSAPEPYGIVTADTELAIRMTLANLDMRLELAGDDD